MSTLPKDDASDPAVSTALPDAPYRGIESFRFIDQQIFAARASETWSLLSNSKLYRAVLLYGDSGTGKSSLINAGLLPRALAQGYVPNRLRIQPFAGREIKVERIRTSAPGEPLVYLPSSFTGLEADGLPSDVAAESFDLSLRAFRKRLREFRRPEGDAAQTSDFQTSPTTTRPLLIFDQFEEFITLFEEALRDDRTEEARRLQQQAPGVQRRVLVTLIKLIRDNRLPVKILFSFREDYLAKLSLLFNHCPQLLNQVIRLVPPQLEVLPEIIRAPFVSKELREHFLRDKGQNRSELSETLAREIAAELGHQGAEAVNLTELQIVCLLLWRSSDPEDLFHSQGIRGLIKSYGASVFLDFTPALRDAAVRLLDQMITASNTRNIIAEEDLLSRATLEGKFELEQLRPALVELSRTQIVRRELRRHLYFYEITSEYLVPWIKEQVAERKAAEGRRIAEAAQREAEARRAEAAELQAAEERRIADAAQRELEAERAEAVAKFEAEQARRRVLRFIVQLMGLSLLAAIILGVIAIREFRHAKAAEAAAKAARQETQYTLDALKLVTSQNQSEALQGIDQVERLINDKKIPADVASVVVTSVLTSQDKLVRQKGLEFYHRVASSNLDLTLAVLKATETDRSFVENLSGNEVSDFNSISNTLPARLYIHISEESQRESARQATEALTGHGYIVPGIQNVGSKAPRDNELRYFRKDDPGMPAPKAIKEILDHATGQQWVERYAAGYENSPNIRPGHFEIWFGAASDSRNGWINAWPVDEHENYVSGVHFTITITTPEGLVIKRQRSGYTPLPAGDYILTANADGFEDFTMPFSLGAREDKKIKLKFVRTSQTRAQPR
jgi:hypothetical protein